MIKSNERIYICGATGTGKTYFAKKLIAKFKKYIIYDAFWEYKIKGATTIHTKEEFVVALQKKIPKIIMQPEVSFFAYVSRIVFYYCRNLVFCVDEVHQYASTWKIDDYLNRILTIGRKLGIGLISISQRPSLTHNTILAQSEHIFCFHSDNKDAQYISDWIPQIKVSSLSSLHTRKYLYHAKNDFCDA